VSILAIFAPFSSFMCILAEKPQPSLTPILVVFIISICILVVMLAAGLTYIVVSKSHDKFEEDTIGIYLC